MITQIFRLFELFTSILDDLRKEEEEEEKDKNSNDGSKQSMEDDLAIVEYKKRFIPAQKKLINGMVTML